jgi:CubicO group peptidase (beta-lactamase class C family)
MTLAEFFQKRITSPLGLVDTQFYLPPAQKDRLAVVYAAKDGKIERATDPKTGQGHYVEGPRVAFAGGAGLLSTARDYGRFLQMLLNGGEIDGVRLLSPKTVELMTVNHVGSLFDEGRTGFGLGFEVVEHMGRSGRYGSEGAFGWGSAYYANYWVDPQEDMLGLYFSQYLPYTMNDLQAKFRTMAYAAIETLERAMAGLQRIRAPYGLGAARALMTLARAIRGDDEDGLMNAREAYQAMLPNGPSMCDKPLMAAAMYHARRGELQRAALIAGCVEGPNVRGKKQICPMDERLDADVRALVSAGMPERDRAGCREAGVSLTLAQVAAIAFDGAPIDTLAS